MNLFTTIFYPKKNYNELNIQKIKPIQTIFSVLISIATVSILTFLWIKSGATEKHQESVFIEMKRVFFYVFSIFIISSYFSSRLINTFQINIKIKAKWHQLLYIYSPTILISFLCIIFVDFSTVFSSKEIYNSILFLIIPFSWIIKTISIGVNLKFKIELSKSIMITILSFFVSCIFLYFLRYILSFLVQ